MLNRDLIVIRFKQPFVDWVNEADPYPDGSRMTLAQVNEDVSTFLIPDYASEDLEAWLKENFLLLFESILEDWSVDENLWPLARRFKLFKAWCEVEAHSMIYDLVDAPLIDDELELSDRIVHEDG